MLALDDRRLQAELRGADRRDIAAGAGADDDDVVGFSHGLLLPYDLLGVIMIVDKSGAYQRSRHGASEWLAFGCGHVARVTTRIRDENEARVEG